MMRGRRDSRACEVRQHAACTTIAPEGSPRCFGTANNCERFRKHLGAQGVDTTRCVAR
jgi:hypothetical protein